MASIADWCCFVGFDYHDCFVQVCILDEAGEVLGNQRVANDMSSILEYVDNTRDGRIIRGAAVETCCAQVTSRSNSGTTIGRWNWRTPASVPR